MKHPRGYRARVERYNLTSPLSRKCVAPFSSNLRFYRRMRHEEDVTPPNEKSHAYHFSITFKGCEFDLLSPAAILALPKCIFKGWRQYIRVFICLSFCSRHCN